MKRSVVSVDVESGAYDVVIGTGPLREAGELVRAVTRARRVALVSDSRVAEMFGARVGAQFVSAGFDVFPLSVEPGEASKSWTVAGELLEAFAHVGLDRTDLVVALGGGVVGDLAGFASATYLRGVHFAQLPTTLLAQVDSSVGGKTGVDLRAGKNLAGAFKQPIIVLADVEVLSSLPEPEWASGLAEVAKSAVIDGEEFVVWLEVNGEAIMRRDLETVGEAVVRSVRFKSRVVSSDVREEGLRECLNYGHTLGHAIENVAGYGTIPHGVAVAEGMRFAARLAVEVASATKEFVLRQDALLDGLDLPALRVGYQPEQLLDAMHADKKARRGEVRFVLPDAPGRWRCDAVEDRLIREHLLAWAASKEGD
jgi:3-dehydroquinate synthase